MTSPSKPTQHSNQPHQQARPNQPQGTQTPVRPAVQQQPAQSRQHEDQSRQKAVDVNKGRDPDSPSGIDPNYNTKPAPDADGGGTGGDQSAHPSPATDPTNAAPEPAQWTDDNPRPPLPKGKDYVAGQPVTQEEYELTEKEAAERVRPEAWERLKGQGVDVQEGQKDASVGWSRDKEGTRPDARPLRDPETQDDDVNKAPGGSGGQGTRADGRARSPDLPGEGPNDRGERTPSREERHSGHHNEDL